MTFKTFARAKELADQYRAGKPAAFHAAKKGEDADLFIYEPIGDSFWGGVSAKAVQDALGEMKGADVLNVYINSEGGDVFQGVAIKTAIERFSAKKKVVTVDGLAASAASMVAMAGTEIIMAPSAMMMIHEAWGMAIGNAADLRQTADLLDKVTQDSVLKSYERTGQTEAQLREWMQAETWMNADEAIARGFADRKTDEDSVPRKVASVPQRIAALARPPIEDPKTYYFNRLRSRLEKAG
jgi:ATP-dependent Clp protease protease subunit